MPSCGGKDDDSGDRSGADGRVRDVPPHAPAPRSNLLLGDAPPAGGDPPRDARALRLRAHRRRDRRRPAPARRPRGAARRARRLGGRAPDRPGHRALAAAGDRRARRRRPPPPPPARRADRLHGLDARRLRARADGDLGRAGRPTWRARPAPSGASWRRCSASPRPTTRASGGSGWRSSTPTSSATCARTAASTASTCRGRTAAASASPTPTSARPTATAELRALVAHEVRRARDLFAERRRRRRGRARVGAAGHPAGLRDLPRRARPRRGDRLRRARPPPAAAGRGSSPLVALAALKR